MKNVKIHASRDYTVFIGSGLLKKAGAFLKEMKPEARICVVTDENVSRLHLPILLSSLRDAGYAPEVFVVPGGEDSKSIAQLEELLEFLAEKHFGRRDLLCALGGGVVGDLTGFCASIFSRGMDFVQFPTTILSAVDSSVGGKTAVNLRGGKNLAGTFYQPIGVWCDIDTFHTLPENIVADGMAEVIKYGVLGDREFFDCLKKGNPDTESMICRCVEMKRDVVAEDEFDTGTRACLNLGHTFAHTIEKASDFEISHGRAVGIGVAMAVRVSVALGYLSKESVDEMEQILLQYHLDIKAPYATEQLVPFALSDKKRSGGFVNFVLLNEIGAYRLEKVPVEKIGEIFELGV